MELADMLPRARRTAGQRAEHQRLHAGLPAAIPGETQLWYLNFSDRPGGRITGMTRFASFWVEDGRIVAPLNVMRFDAKNHAGSKRPHKLPTRPALHIHRGRPGQLCRVAYSLSRPDAIIQAAGRRFCAGHPNSNWPIA